MKLRQALLNISSRFALFWEATNIVVGSNADLPWCHNFYVSLSLLPPFCVVGFTPIAGKPLYSSSPSFFRVSLPLPQWRYFYSAVSHLGFLLLCIGATVISNIFQKKAIIIVTHPFLYSRLLQALPVFLVYYNLDDYRHYLPKRLVDLSKAEKKLVEQSNIVLCLSVYQCSRFAAQYPLATSRIIHFPLAVPPPPDPAKSSCRSSLTLDHTTRSLIKIGYVGTLSNRVDWRLVLSFCRKSPDCIFFFYGNPDDSEVYSVKPSSINWMSDREKVRLLPNTVFSGTVEQTVAYELPYLFDINWIPYDINHSFNLASSPTKIFDYFPSLKPLVSTKLPECMLYQDVINFVDHDTLCEGFFANIIYMHDSSKRDQQLNLVQNNSWNIRALDFAACISN